MRDHLEIPDLNSEPNSSMTLKQCRKNLAAMIEARAQIENIQSRSQERGELEPNIEEVHTIQAILCEIGLTSKEHLESAIKQHLALADRLRTEALSVISKPSTEVKSPLLIDIDPIRNAPVLMPETWQEIEAIIERPLRAAMHDLWEKGITTVESSANSEDAVIGSVFFDILSENLTTENHEIAQSLGGKLKQKRGRSVYSFKNAVSTEASTADIVKWSRGITQNFHNQK